MEILERESEMDSKALGGGCVESKMSQSQKLCGQVPGEASGVSRSSENCGGSVLVVGENGGGIDVNSRNAEVDDVELNITSDSGEIGFGSEGVEKGEEASVGEIVAEENQTTRGSLGFGSEKDIIVKPENDRMNDGDGPVVEEASIVEGNEGIGVEKLVTKDDGEKGNDALPLYEVDCSRKIEVSGDSISLFVEVFGPMDGANQADDWNCNDQHVLRDGDSDQEYLCERNGTLSSCDEGIAIAKVSETDDSMLDMVKSSSIDEEVNVQNEVGGDDSGNQKSSFIVGDLIWAKTKTQLWWPGMICDPSNSSKGAANSHKNDSFLVKYYGNANFIWCSSSQLKHFLDYFTEMSLQNNSRSFHGAVERALCEVGKRIKVEMTCSCSLRESRKFSAVSAGQNMERYLLSKDRIGELGAFSKSQFQPASFLQLINYLAQGTSQLDKIKLIIAQNCLSAFYHSLGHRQLPMHQLRPTDFKDSANNGLNHGEKDEDLNKLSTGNYWDEEVVKRKPRSSTLTSKIARKENCTGETEVFAEQLSPLRSPEATKDDLLNGEGRIDRSSGKGYESRERKKSKYLSYPYIDPKKGPEDSPTSGENLEDLKKVHHLGAEMNSNSGQSNGGKKSRKPGSQKSSYCFDMLGKATYINSSSAEILSELHLTALNCLYSKGRQYSGSVNEFLHSFRKFSFLNIETANKHIGDEVEVKVDGMTESSNSGSKGANEEDAAEHTSCGGKPKRRRRKKEDGTLVGTVSCGSVRNALNGLGVIKCEGVSSDTTKSEKVPKKRKKAGTVLGIPENKTVTGLPDLNGNIPASSVEDRQATGYTTCHYGLESSENSHARTVGLLDPGRNNIKFVQLLKDVQAMGPNFLNSISQQNNMQGEIVFTSEVMARQSEVDGNSIQFGSQTESLQPTPTLSTGAKPERMERKRKEKTPNLPDLNGNVAESISSGNKTPDIYSASPQVKPPRKRRRSQSTAAVPDIIANNNKAQNSVGGSAPSLAPLAQPLLPADGLKSPAKPSGSNPQTSDPPDLLFIKKNLEMMTSMLEKAGNNLSPEMRAKLESEIKGFMQKISSMVGSSSS